MSIALTVMVFIFTAFLVVAVGSIIANRRRQLQSRLAGIQKMTDDADPEDMLRLPFMQRVILPAMNNIGHVLGNITPREIRTRVDKKIRYAGSPKNINFFTLFFLQVIAGGLLFFLAWFLTGTFQVEGGQKFLIVTLMTLGGFFLPYGVISSKAESRQQTIRRTLPDFLDLLLVSVEAGLGFDMALKRVASQMPGPLSAEVKRGLDAIRMGGNREEALRGIAWRSGVSELSSFISSVIQAEQLGSNITSTLQVQAEAMRQKRRQRAEEMATKAQVKLIFPLVFFIFPSLFVVIIGPAVIQIFRTLIGGL